MDISGMALGGMCRGDSGAARKMSCCKKYNSSIKKIDGAIIIKWPKKQNRVAIFNDASNVWRAQKVRGAMFDFGKLVKYIKSEYKATSVTGYYYTAYPAEGTRAYSTEGKHKFFTYLKKGLGFIVRKKELETISIETSEGQGFQEKGNMDVEMTIDSIHFMDRYDTALFFTGDSDFLALITYIRNPRKKCMCILQKITSLLNLEQDQTATLIF